MRVERNVFVSVAVVLQLICAASLADEHSTVVLPEGTEISLELLHHVSSSYNQPGSDVFLVVAEDVTVGDRTVIPQRHVVRGVMNTAAQSKSMGRAGYLSFRVDSIVAPDGTEIPLNAEFGSYGRDRTEATGRMSAAFGLAGLFTKGRMAYLEKGTSFVAFVSEDRDVDPPTWSVGTGQLRIAEHEGEASVEDDTINLSIEKGRNLRPIDVRIESPLPRELTQDELRQFALVRVNELDLPQPVTCLATERVSRDSDDDGLPEHEMRCDAWDILRYCDSGISSLVFQVPMNDGSIVSARADIDVLIRKK